ncbi:MAG: hypothetical protein ACNA8S_05490 [Deferrisomatales bacterium]
MRRPQGTPATVLLLFLAGLLGGPAAAGDEEEGLRRAWDGHRERAAVAGLPERLEIRSREGPAEIWAEVLGVLPFPFEVVAAALEATVQWCDFVPLHFNIKACVYGLDPGEPFLVLYSGRKGYGTAEDAHRFDYGFAARVAPGPYLGVELRSQGGPMGTRDYHLRVEALPVEGGTFVRFGSSYGPSRTSRAATALYLGTLGRSKMGFSREGEPPVPVRGVRGIVERNGVRYYLALQAFLHTLHLAGEERFESGVRTWFDLASQYPELHETSWETYRRTKRREREGQLELQRALEAGGLSALPGAR